MENKNIAELLKDCPPGMELDCTMYDNCTFEGIEDVGYIEILVKTPSGRIRLTKEGCYIRHDDYAKCVIFPKGKDNWDGFVPPVKFKDGDIVYFERNGNKYLAIFKDIKNNYLHSYIYFSNISISLSLSSYDIAYIQELRLATEEEKQKLFKEIKHQDYCWNAETKTLEKLINPKFKVGDVIQDKDGYKVEITEVDIDYECYTYLSKILNGIGGISFEEQDDWELVPDEIKPKFKVGDKIKRKNTNEEHTITKVTENTYEYSITEYCNGFIKIKYQDNWELVPNKFDITTLVPFESRVLVRDHKSQTWRPAIWGFFDENCGNHLYGVVGGICFAMCIPFEGNEHLRGKIGDCSKYYKTWKE